MGSKALGIGHKEREVEKGIFLCLPPALLCPLLSGARHNLSTPDSAIFSVPLPVNLATCPLCVFPGAFLPCCHSRGAAQNSSSNPSGSCQLGDLTQLA